MSDKIEIQRVQKIEEEREPQSKWKSKTLWIALTAELITILTIFGVWEKVGIEAATAKLAIMSAIQILVLTGILVDPSNKEDVKKMIARITKKGSE